MACLPRFVRSCFATILVAAAAVAQPLVPPEPVALDSLEAFAAPAANWKIAGGLTGNPRTEKTLVPAPGRGVLVSVPDGANKGGHLLTRWEHGDLHLDVEFLLPPGSNSGVYLQGRYEIQLFDSWGVKEPRPTDCGAIYERWDETRPAGQNGYEGKAPRANASRAPGLWQTLHIEFEAPRFDAAGKKTKNARFVKVVHNGFTIHENVEVTGPTRSGAFNDERAAGPLMIQGDHGAIALRNLAVKRFAVERVAVQGLRYKLYAGDFKRIGEYDTATPKSEGEPARFAHTAVEKSGKFALVFTGTLVAPRDGTYGFSTESSGLSQLSIAGRPVVVPLERASHPGTIELKAGSHPFRLDLVQTSAARPSIELSVEGPGIASHSLTVRDERGPGPRPRQLLVPVKDQVLVQRGFVPFEPKKRLYAVSVGTPAGVHFAYDFETGALLRAWRGGFIDTLQMWDNRGNDQLAKPVGPSLTFDGKPVAALIEFAQTGDWPDQPDALWSSQGYSLGADGIPVFAATLGDIAFRDRIAPVAEGRGLTRTIEAKGALSSWSTWVLLAEADVITAQPNGAGWIVGDRGWYLDWPADAGVAPVLRTRNGRQQLAVPITRATLEKPIVYTLVW